MAGGEGPLSFQTGVFPSQSPSHGAGIVPLPPLSAAEDRNRAAFRRRQKHPSVAPRPKPGYLSLAREPDAPPRGNRRPSILAMDGAQPDLPFPRRVHLPPPASSLREVRQGASSPARCQGPSARAPSPTRDETGNVLRPRHAGEISPAVSHPRKGSMAESLPRASPPCPLAQRHRRGRHGRGRQVKNATFGLREGLGTNAARLHAPTADKPFHLVNENLEI
jgi:hypothetical protein